MNISAKDKGTGKENKITIKSDSGLSEAEIQRMVQEAEENAEADKKVRELIEARNSAESATHSLKKDYEEIKGSLNEEEQSKFEEAVKALDESIKGDDVEAINKSVQSLFEAAGPMLEKKRNEDEAKARSPEHRQGEATVDASFKEVDPEEKK
jgi:molecular chaperone DnaK